MTNDVIRISFAWKIFAFNKDYVRAVTLVSLALLLVFGLTMRFYGLDHIPGVNGDEALDSVQVRDVIAGRPTVLRMPTGRLLSPIYGAWIMALESWRTASFYALRLPAAIAGVVTLPLSLLFFRAGFSPFVVLSFTLLTWSSPMAMAYARTGIEQSLILPAQLLVFFLVLRGSVVSIVLGYLALLLVHPIHVFLSPFVLALLVPRFLKQNRWIWGAFGLLFLGGIAFEIAILPQNYSRFLKWDSIWNTISRWETIREFVKYYVRLLSGITAFEQYSSPVPRFWVWTWDLFIGITFLFVQLLGLFRLYRGRDLQNFLLIVGNLLTVLAYFIITGRDAVTPGVARYALILLLPAFLSFSICLEKCLPTRWGWYRLAILSLIAWGWMIQMGIFYFETIQKNNSTSFRAYLTGPIEPKLAALDWIKRDTAVKGVKESSLTIIAEDWWTYWPLRYLSADSSPMKVLLLEKGGEVEQNFFEMMEQGAYLVGFARTSPFEIKFQPLVRQGVLERFEITGYGNRAVLAIWRVRGA